ncbi:MAG: hypothetical protein DRP19_05235 [Thermotogae bacterium]|nr:MAG: hypothetical protein DRP19_05235 [Thermotogota bacterium]
MKAKLGYRELYELFAASYFTKSGSLVTKKLKTFGIEFRPSEELISFRDKLLSNQSVSVKVVLSFLSELSTGRCFFFARPHENDEIIELEQEIDYIEKNFQTLLSVFKKNYLLNLLHLESLEDLSTADVEKAIHSIKDATKLTRWFLIQLALFPDTALDLLLSGIETLIKTYVSSKLRNVNLPVAKRLLKKKQIVFEAFENYAEYYSLPIKGKNVFLSFQNSLPHNSFGNVDIPEMGWLVIMGTSEITEDFAYQVSMESWLNDCLKALSDDNRSKIIKILSKGPREQREIVSLLNLGKSTVSHHIGVLRGAGFVVDTPDHRHLQLNKERIEKFLKEFRRYIYD